MTKKIQDLWAVDFSMKKLPSTKNQIIELIGAPDDAGIYNVGGRLGASYAPAAIRKMLSTFCTGKYEEITSTQLKKGTDISQGDSIEKKHLELKEKIIQCFQAKKFPIVLGGGHDYGFPHVASASEYFGKNISVINVDAHLDMRPLKQGLITSGSPFYLCIENKVINPKNLTEFGIQEHCNDPTLFRYAEKNKVNVYELTKLRESKKSISDQFKKILLNHKKKKQKIIVQFDMDAVATAYAPGVSAPQADGFTSAELLQMIDVCAEFSEVVSIGFYEVSPPLDRDLMTVRLCALAIHRFCCRKLR